MTKIILFLVGIDLNGKIQGLLFFALSPILALAINEC
jgi:hypothetical protein